MTIRRGQVLRFALSLLGMVLPALTVAAQETPLFMTHHSPVGAWSSFTFGLPGLGVGIDHEQLKVDATGDLLVAVSRGPGQVRMLPFFAGAKGEDYEGKVAGNTPPAAFKRWSVVPARELQRRLTPGVDEFTAGDLRLRVYSPRLPLPDPDTKASLKDALCPAVLVEVEVDNRRSEKTAYGFFGLAYQGQGRIRPLDWSSEGQLCGIAFRGNWAIAAKAKPGEVFTLRAASIAANVESGQPIIHPGGGEGGILFAVPAGKRSTLTCAVGFHHAGSATQGIAARYAYSDDFADVESVCRHALDSAERIKAAAAAFDAQAAAGGASPRRVQLFAQASQAYYANSSLLRDAGGRWYWSVCEGQFAWRNTLDLAADHLPFELWRHPWISRNVIDLFFDRYSYRDRLRFPDDPKTLRPGGLSFTHDQGNYTAYSPPGRSGYELPGRDGAYSFMTSEQLLNGIYCAAAYAIATGDRAWSARRVKEAGELLASLENRDQYDPAKRDGLLKGESDRVEGGAEITTYDALDHSLKIAQGNIYIAVKTWCAALMLGEMLDLGGDAPRAAAARAFAKKTAASLLARFDRDKGRFPPNLYAGGDSHVIAALEPLVVPLYGGLENRLREYPELVDALRQHARSGLRKGVCLDPANGGLRLSSSSTNTWPSKAVLTLAAIEWLEGKPAEQVCPSAVDNLAYWMQVAAAKRTVSDQIQSDTRTAIGGSYYPRCATFSLLLGGPAARAKARRD